MTEKNEQKVEVRLNQDDSLDEIVGTGWFHLEQMDYNKWWMNLGPHNVWLSAKGKITANIELNAYPQTFAQRPAQATSQQGERGLETPRRVAAVETLLAAGWKWDGDSWAHPVSSGPDTIGGVAHVDVPLTTHEALRILLAVIQGKAVRFTSNNVTITTKESP